MAWLHKHLLSHTASPDCSKSRRPCPDPARRARLRLEYLEDRLAPAGTITGLVFQDYHADGTFDNSAQISNTGTGSIGLAVDRPLAGVTVTAFDAAGVVRGSTVTTGTLTTSGTNRFNFVLTVSGTGPYRVQFGTLPAGFFSGPHGPDSKTTVQFVPDGNSTNVSLGLVQPNQVSQANPDVVTACYVFGDQINGPNANASVIIDFPYNAGATLGTSGVGPYTVSGHTLMVPANQVGTVWGLAATPDSSTLFAAAYTKRHAGYGPSGDGAIYLIDPARSAVVGVINLNAIFGANTAGVNFRAGANYDYDTDSGDIGWDAVGKTALGGIDISADGRTLYAMNLADRSLYIIPTAGPYNAAAIRRVPIPVAADATGVTANNPLGDLRPFAVRVFNGQVYVGAVNSAETTQDPNDLHAYVFRFDPTTTAFAAAPVFEANLNYPRGSTSPVNGASAAWNPWSAKYASDLSFALSYPQPMLTGLAFDAAGNLVLGLRDRTGDQGGNFTQDDPTRPGLRQETVTAGDTLRAFGSPAAGWVLENNGRGPAGEGTGPQFTGLGPGGGEFYYQQNYPGIHDYVATGTVAEVPGYADVVVSVFDPSEQDVRSGGFRWFNNDTGATDKAYELYGENSQGAFGKSSGVGGLTFLLAPAPVEIGNRVWVDTHHNGIQEADTPNIAGVTVHLYAPTGVLLATAVTDSKGEYYFSNGPGTSTANAVYNVAGLSPNTAGYTIRLDNAADYAPGGPLFGYTPTVAGAGTDLSIVSRGFAVGATDDRTPVTLGGPGQNDHTFDFGFVLVPAPSIASLAVTKTVDDPTPLVGSVIAFTIAVTDNGPANATGVRLTDVLPAGLTFVGAAPARGTYDPASGVWTVGNLPDHARTTLTLYALVSGPAPVLNVVLLSGSPVAGVPVYPQGPLAGGPQTGPTTTPVVGPQSGPTTMPPVNLGVTQTVSTQTPQVGQPVVYTVGVTNGGPGTSTCTEVSLPLPVGLQFVSLVGVSQGTYDTTSGLWNVGPLPVGATALLQFFARATVPGIFLLTAVGSSCEVNVGANNAATTQIVAQVPPGQVSKQFFLSDTTPTPLTAVPQGALTVRTMSVPGFTATGASPGSPPLVQVYDRATGQRRFSFLAYDAGFLGGVSVAVADVNGDGTADIITAPRAGGLPLVKVFDGTDGALLSAFWAYDPAFAGGVNLAAASGTAGSVIVTAPLAGGLPLVKAFRPGGQLIRAIWAYAPAFTGGVNVATADLNGDGVPDIVTAPMAGGQPLVEVFDGATGALSSAFWAYTPGFLGGVNVAATDIDGRAEIVTGTGTGGAPLVEVFQPGGKLVSAFDAFPAAYTGGVNVAACDLNGDGVPDLVVAPASGGTPQVEVFDGATGTLLDAFAVGNIASLGGICVAAH